MPKKLLKRSEQRRLVIVRVIISFMSIYPKLLILYLRKHSSMIAHYHKFYLKLALAVEYIVMPLCTQK